MKLLTLKQIKNGSYRDVDLDKTIIIVKSVPAVNSVPPAGAFQTIPFVVL